MIKEHKYFLTFLGIATFLGVISSLSINKLIPLLLHPTVYFCQTFFHTVSTKLPSQFGLFISSVGIIFLISIIGKLLWQAKKIYKYRKHLLNNITTHHHQTALLKKLDIENKTIIVKDTQPFAYCFGIRKPKIYFSTGLTILLDTNELEAVLLHEKHHVTHKDTLTLLIASVLQSVFFFFPLLSDLLFSYRIEQELKADKSAVTSSKSSHALISALKKLINVPTTPSLAFSAIADEDTLEARIHSLGNITFQRKKYRVSNVAISLFSLFILFGVVLAPIQVQAITMQNMNQDAMMLCLEGNACALWCRNHKSVYPYSPAPRSTVNYSSK